VLHCPWHHWEYDITTGRSLFNVDRSRLITYEVEKYDVEEQGECIYVWVKPRRALTARDRA
jgi:nitrite reductase/ring-hydroxylating ferredoxin subunit